MATALAVAALTIAGCALAQSGVSPPSPPSVPAVDIPRQVPGYYHQRIGTLQVTALFDGVVTLPRAQILGLTPAQIDALLQGRYVPEGPQGLQTAVNAYLVQIGGRRVLVDAGTADCFGPGLGQVVPNLRVAGFQPEQVYDVLLTHAHPDHLCGVLGPQGTPAFPNATLWLDDTELKYWQGDEVESFEADVDRQTAIASRRALLARAARQGWWVAGAHMPFPGLGHVRQEGKGYAWVPAEFSPLAQP